ncbi:MAG: phosphoheptose isomerase [Flavobacteriaceae bacterium]|nr:phosphoheptose isomerase [Flavobacteriaceae bacterium]
MMYDKYFERAFFESIEVKQNCIKQGFLSLSNIAHNISNAINASGKLMLCGNGGSAADAQHLAAELLVRLRPHINRSPIPAITLAQDISTLTACANDYSFDDIFERNLTALCRPGDCLLAISTSGKSPNIINVLKAAKNQQVKAFAFLGKGGGSCKELADDYFLVPSDNTAAIQEAHIVAGHALMEAIEDKVIAARKND